MNKNWKPHLDRGERRLPVFAVEIGGDWLKSQSRSGSGWIEMSLGRVIDRSPFRTRVRSAWIAC